MQDLIDLLLSRHSLDRPQARHAVDALANPDFPQQTKAAFLRALREKGETAAEIAAFAEALLERAVDPGLSHLTGPMLDVCGTGGDRMGFFNISTTSMFVLAAGGARVVKHGNRAITSQCGGADVLEALGIQIELGPDQLRACVEKVGAGFVFAPRYHPAFRAIAPVRKSLAAEGVSTVFNLLGPLLNPARPSCQLVGVYSAALLPLYRDTLAHLGRTRAWALHGDGTDELTITGPSDVCETTPCGPRDFRIDPRELGIPTALPSALIGSDKTSNALLLERILSGTEQGPREDVVTLNAAAGFVVTGLAPDLPTGLQLARDQIRSGRALQKLHALRQIAPAHAAAS